MLVLFYREVLLNAIRALGSERGVFIGARRIGKAKTFVQAWTVMLTLSFAVLKEVAGPSELPVLSWDVATVATPLMGASVLITVLSGLVYLSGHRGLFTGRST